MRLSSQRRSFKDLGDLARLRARHVPEKGQAASAGRKVAAMRASGTCSGKVAVKSGVNTAGSRIGRGVRGRDQGSPKEELQCVFLPLETPLFFPSPFFANSVEQ